MSTSTTAPTALKVRRVFSNEGIHPYDELTWEKRDVVQTNWKTGETVFKQLGVEFPTSWSLNASTIVTTKYFRGAAGAPERESSLKQLIDRIVTTYTTAAREHGYLNEADAAVFADELTWLLVNQHFSFNSPVWFNVGTNSPQQVSACFILSVDDSMDSILNWYREEGFIFKGGSGAGLNLSRIRSSKELLSSGGTASGPVSFMRGADASAGTIKSGGATRRAAKMVVLDVDHPDIVEFVETKAREEDKIRALRDAGFDMDLGGRDIVSVQYQNANNSVRVTDEFMKAVEDGKQFGLRARETGKIIEKVDARELFDKIVDAAWLCADPGLQYDDTINSMHTNPATGKITASNPCSEYMSLDNSACNLASLNLMKFRLADGTFDVDRFTAAVEIIITAMEISIAFGDFPTDAIAERTRQFRQLGIGYANLGALLMASGLPYDSAEGRGLAASITSLMTGVAYRRSAEIAEVVGAYDGYEVNKAGHMKVMRKHAQHANQLVDVLAGTEDEFNGHVDMVAGSSLANGVAAAAKDAWGDVLKLGKAHGFRNAQASVLAPTGTIGFMMDCDTTGIEPDFSLVKFKKLVGGGSLQVVNGTVTEALYNLGHDVDEVADIEEFIREHGNVVDAPHLDPRHYAIFDTAMGVRSIEPMGHVKMMAAAQPFLSGAISKTVNLPESATREDIAHVYMESWRMGLKATAVYRDNCKVGQPLADAKASKKVEEPAAEAVSPVVVERAVRKRLPKSRSSLTTSFAVGGAEGYMTTSWHEDGELGEVFLKFGKQGSTLAGIMDAFSIAVSIGLQYGVPLETYVSKFTNQSFEPSGLTDDKDVRTARSIIDYVFRRIALDHMPFDNRSVMGIHTAAERTNYLDTGSYELEEVAEVRQDEIAPEVPSVPATKPPSAPADSASSVALLENLVGASFDTPLCMTCGVKMRPSGSCAVCEGCGSTSGCS